MIRVPLTRGAFALIDECDESLVCQFKWHLNSGGYAVRTTKPRLYQVTVLMHRLIMAPRPGMEVDHINGDTLDNRRANLRVCDRFGNARNRSGQGVRRSPRASQYKGVRQLPNGRKWMAEIGMHGCTTYLGAFATEIEAAKAYNAAAIEHFGEFARLNQV